MVNKDIKDDNIIKNYIEKNSIEIINIGPENLGYLKINFEYINYLLPFISSFLRKLEYKQV